MLRIILNAGHTDEQIDHFIEVSKRFRAERQL
nr:hypothetical protein [uncultured bacterium]